jgi:hypothetical protein
MSAPLTIASILAAHRAGASPVETIRATYARIAAHADPALFIALKPEAEALAQAARLEAEGGRDLPLFGVPVAVTVAVCVFVVVTVTVCEGLTVGVLLKDMDGVVVIIAVSVRVCVPVRVPDIDGVAPLLPV